MKFYLAAIMILASPFFSNTLFAATDPNTSDPAVERYCDPVQNAEVLKKINDYDKQLKTEKKLRNLSLILFTCLGIISTNAFSALGCTGNVQMLALGPGNGIVQVNIGYGVWNICSVQSSINGVGTETCKAWYTMLLSDRATGRQSGMDFDTTNYPSLTCNTVGNWATPNPMPYFVFD